MKPVNRPGARSAPGDRIDGCRQSVGFRTEVATAISDSRDPVGFRWHASERAISNRRCDSQSGRSREPLFRLRPIAAYPIKTGVRDASTVSRMNLASDAQSLRVYHSDASLRERCPLPSPGVAAQCRKCAAIFRGCGHSHQAMPGSSQRSHPGTTLLADVREWRRGRDSNP
jgi:hypothetical protein